MQEPLYLTLFTPDAAPEKAFVAETSYQQTTPGHQAERQNNFARDGRTETLLAGTPSYWQRKLSRALVVGCGFGVLATIVVSWLWPG